MYKEIGHYVGSLSDEDLGIEDIASSAVKNVLREGAGHLIEYLTELNAEASISTEGDLLFIELGGFNMAFNLSEIRSMKDGETVIGFDTDYD